MAGEFGVGGGGSRPIVGSMTLPPALHRRRVLPNPLTAKEDPGKIAGPPSTSGPMSPRLISQISSENADKPRPMPKRRSVNNMNVVPPLSSEGKAPVSPPRVLAPKPKPPPPNEPPPLHRPLPPIESPSRPLPVQSPRLQSMPSLPSRVQSPPAETPVGLPRYQPPVARTPVAPPPGKLPSVKPPPVTSVKPLPSAKPKTTAKPLVAVKPRPSVDLANTVNEMQLKNRRMSGGWDLGPVSPSVSNQKLLSPNVSSPKLLGGAESPLSTGGDLRRSGASSPALIRIHSSCSGGIGSDGEVGRRGGSPNTSVGDRANSRSSSRANAEPMADALRPRGRSSSSPSPGNLQAQLAMCALAATRFRRVSLPPLSEPPMVPLSSKPKLPPEATNVNSCSDNISDDIVFSEDDDDDGNGLYDTVTENLRDDIISGRIGSTLPPSRIPAAQIASKPPVGSSTLPKSFRNTIEQPIPDQGYVCPVRPTSSSVTAGDGNAVDIEPIYDADNLADIEPIYDADTLPDPEPICDEDSVADDEDIYDAVVEHDFPPPPPMMLEDEYPEIPEVSEAAQAGESFDAFGDAEEVKEDSDSEWDAYDEDEGELTYETTDAFAIEAEQGQAAVAIAQPPQAISPEAEAAEKQSQDGRTLRRKTLESVKKVEKKEKKLREKQREKEETKRKKADQERMKQLTRRIQQQKKRFKITGNEEVELLVRANFSCKSCPDDYLLYDGGDVFEVLSHKGKAKAKAKVVDDCWLVRRKRDGTYGMVEKLNMTPVDETTETEDHIPPPFHPVSPLSASYPEDDLYDNGEGPDEVEDFYAELESADP